MRPLNGQDMLRIWEWGLAASPLERAVTLLALRSPDLTREELAALPIGERDRRLLRLRERTFGKTLTGCAECPRCREQLELAFSTEEICVEAADTALERTLVVGPLRVQYRLPTSADLSAVAGAPDVESASRELARRCVLEARQAEQPIDPAELPSDVLALLEDSLAEADPQAEVRLDLSCPQCRHRWQAVFDIAQFLWSEVATQAKRLLMEVHTLARAYGWRESDILAMSAPRRQAYIELVS